MLSPKERIFSTAARPKIGKKGGNFFARYKFYTGPPTILHSTYGRYQGLLATGHHLVGLSLQTDPKQTAVPVSPDDTRERPSEGDILSLAFVAQTTQPKHS